MVAVCKLVPVLAVAAGGNSSGFRAHTAGYDEGNGMRKIRVVRVELGNRVKQQSSSSKSKEN